MLVHLLHRSLDSSTSRADELFRAWAGGLQRAGVDVRVDACGASDAPQDFAQAVEAASADLAAQWADGAQPDVIHAFGVTATAAALRAGPPARLIATFAESPVVDERAAELASQVAAVVSLSAQEHHAWGRRGVRSLLSGPLPLAVPIQDRDACACPGGDLVTLGTGPDLDELLRSMRYWQGRLTVMGSLPPARLAQVRSLVTSLGLESRVQLRPALTGSARARGWSQAALLYAGVEDSQHGLPVLEAAAHGVPALARNVGANRDVVISGTTGLLIDPPIDGTISDSWTLGRALVSLLSDGFQIKAMGTAALVRVGAAHADRTTSSQLSELYAHVVAEDTVQSGDAVPCPERDALVLKHVSLARQLAGWYAGRGQSLDDLIQVASIGLVQAATRYDPSHGREFHSFAIPTILGELRKHFRDNAWAVRVPRGLQETTLLVQRAAESLSQTYGRSPTVAELGQHLGVAEEEVRMALQTDGEARFTRSLDAPLDSDPVDSLMGKDDEALEAIELRHDVRDAIARLPEREQRILVLRFYGERTQNEISEQLGISQVHVSRVLSRTLAALRDYVMYDVPLPLPRTSAERVAVAS
jgi:RNA polymerase sigma-B factor